MKHFKWTLIMSMLTLIFLIPAHGAKAANGPAEGEGGYEEELIQILKDGAEKADAIA